VIAAISLALLALCRWGMMVYPTTDQWAWTMPTTHIPSHHATVLAHPSTLAPMSTQPLLSIPSLQRRNTERHAGPTAPAMDLGMKHLFENHRMRILDFRLAPGRRVTIEHSLPTLRWQAGAGNHRLLVNGESTPSVVNDKQVFFAYPGQTWELENDGSEEYRQIIFQFLEPSPKYTEAEVKALLKAAVYHTAVGTKFLFENEWCRVWDFSLAPGEGDPADIHQHVMDYVFLYVGEGHPHRLVGTNPDGSQQFDSVAYDGDVQWFDGPNGGFEADGKTVVEHLRHGGYNGNEHQFTEYLVELK